MKCLELNVNHGVGPSVWVRSPDSWATFSIVLSACSAVHNHAETAGTFCEYLAATDSHLNSTRSWPATPINYL
ncbi:MAG: hypothetical protein Fues2KO_04630 [Fuerstiella sp.]